MLLIIELLKIYYFIIIRNFKYIYIYIQFILLYINIGKNNFYLIVERNKSCDKIQNKEF